MKQLLSILGTITIAGSGMAGLLGNAPAKNNIIYQQTSNLKKFSRVKRQYQTDISTYVTQTDLGTIRPGSSSGGRISDLRILNAFVRANPNLPNELRATAGRNRIIYVSVNYGDRAIIDVHSGTSYTGSVQVTFNGGQTPTQDNYSFGLPSNWGSRLSLSTLPNLNRNLGNILGTSEERIIQTFMFNNQHLPNELINILRVRDITNSSARLYVPAGNNRYEGDLVVFFSGRSNTTYLWPGEYS
ncbi:hypothetical protein [Spiroplasma endosymbiont of Eupeodes luniger]|uniref:hypothetical protein n=1 Tax=Spiroplasma endosymbiont of Eupeodes luniger TaxID=3066300 RepID=UPI0030CD3624